MANGYDQTSRNSQNYNDDYNRGERGGSDDSWGNYRSDDDGRDRWRQSSGNYGDYERSEDSYSSRGSAFGNGGQGGSSGNEYNRGGQSRDHDFAGSGSRSGGQYDRNSSYGSDRQSGGYGGMSDDRFGSADRGRYGAQSYGQRSGYQGGGYDNDRGFFEKAGDEVKSWFGDSEAERRREQDEHRGRGPKNYTRSDDRIRDDVSDHLTDDGSLDASDIEVTVSDGEVTLDGTVSSRMDKRRAEDCAYRVSGIDHVQNNLRVKSNDWSSDTSRQTASTTAGMARTGKADSSNGL